jgi:hypothetical protein
MKQHTLLLPALAVGIGLSFLAGCQQNGHSGNGSDRSTDRTGAATRPSTQAAAAMNARSADSLLAEAAHSEAQGDYSHALEVYQYLHSFPEASRPRDLDQRIDALRQKTQAQPQR